MSISYIGSGAAAANATAASVAYPANIQVGDLLLLAAVNKYSAYTSVPPTDFTLLTERIGGSGGTGVDAGNVRVAVWYKIATGNETGSVSVTKATETGSIILARMFLYRRTAGTSWDISGDSGTSSTGSTAWSAVASNNQSVGVGDFVLCVTGTNTDDASFSGSSLTATGATLTFVSEREDVGSPVGHAVRLYIVEYQRTAGETTSPLTFSSTASTSTPDGATIFVKLGEGVSLTADYGSYSISGNDAGLNRGYTMVADGYQHFVAGSDASFSIEYVQGAINFTVDSGVHVLSGQNASLSYGRFVSAVTGQYVLSGQNAQIRTGFGFAAALGTYAAIWQTTASSRTYNLSANTGSVILSGKSAYLYVGAETGKAWADDAWYSGAWNGTVWADNTLAPGAYSLSAQTGQYQLSQTSTYRAWFDEAWSAGAWSGASWTSGESPTKLIYGRIMAADTGIIYYTGDEPVLRDILLQTVPSIPDAAYVLSGQSATLAKGVGMVASAGSYALTGGSASLLKGRSLSAGFGNYLSIGGDAEFVIGIGEILNTIYYSLSGYGASFTVNYRLTAESGSYSLTGENAGLIFGDVIFCETGVYSLFGQDASSTRGWVLNAETGHYTVGGQVQPLPPTVLPEPERPAGGYRRRKKRNDEVFKRYYDEFPTPEEVQEERERLGILPKKSQKFVINAVKQAANVETRSQASFLANAYLQEPQQRKLMDRLMASSESQKVKWRDDMFAITQALILDSLRKKADQDLLDRMIKEEEAEAAEVNEILELWMEL